MRNSTKIKLLAMPVFIVGGSLLLSLAIGVLATLVSVATDLITSRADSVGAFLSSPWGFGAVVGAGFGVFFWILFAASDF